MKTKNCVVCGRPAGSYIGGHVHHGAETITAAFCSSECLNTPATSCKAYKSGCHGAWNESMGTESFGEVCYIDVDGMHKIEDQ